MVQFRRAKLSPVSALSSLCPYPFQALIIALPLCPSSPLLQGPKNTPPHTKNHSYDYRTSSAAKCCGRLFGRYREGQDLPPGTSCPAGKTRSAYYGDGTRYSHFLSPQMNSWSQPDPMNWLEQVPMLCGQGVGLG